MGERLLKTDCPFLYLEVALSLNFNTRQLKNPKPVERNHLYRYVDPKPLGVVSMPNRSLLILLPWLSLNTPLYSAASPSRHILATNQYPPEQQQVQDVQRQSLMADNSPENASPEDLVKRGEQLWKLTQYEEAITTYTQAIQINPKHAEAYYNRGIAYATLQRFEEAIADFNQAIQNNPKYAEAYFNRGIIYAKQHRYEEAIADYSQAIQINPKYKDAYGYRALAYLEIGNKTQSRQDLQTAARLFQQQKNLEEY